MENKDLFVQEENNRLGLQLLDWKALKHACMDNESLVERLLNLYLQQVPEWKQSLRTAFRKVDGQDARVVCHTIRGATSAIHADACVDAIEKLNEFARKDDLVNAEAALEEAISVIDKTGLLIEKLILE